MRQTGKKSIKTQTLPHSGLDENPDMTADDVALPP
jgi:hypothetical protein